MSISNPAPRAVTPALNRTNIILIVLLIVQIAVTAYLYWPDSSVITNGAPLLGNVTTADVTGLTITDTNGRSVNFAKEGDTWTLAGTDGYPARADKITETLDKLTKLTTDRLVTQTAGSHDRLQVAEDNYQRKIDITTASGTQTLYFGSSTGASATHVRAANDAATYLESELATWELDTLSTTWIDVAYFKVPKDQITEVTLQNASGTYTFVPTSDTDATQWTLADATADEPIAAANINTLIDRIATLNMQSVLGKSESPDYGLDNPLATVTVTYTATTSDTTAAPTKTTTLVVGAKDDANNTYYLKSSDSDYYVQLAAFTGDELVEKQRSDFMIQNSDASSDANATPTEPTVSASTAATDTTTVEESATPTATVSAAITATTTVEASATPTTTVAASEVTTDTNASDEAEPTATSPTATGTPSN